MTGHANPKGFTIIEVMLFLAITGLMMAGVLAAVTGSINRQRYQDAATSLTDFIQGQYNLVDNVHTNRPTTLECDSGGFAIGASQPRGASDCSIIGRYLTTTDGKLITSQPVYAQRDIRMINESDYTTEAEYIALLDLAMTDDYDGDSQDYRVSWGTYVYTDKTTPSAYTDFTMLLIKLPTNGLIRTYAVANGDKTIAETISGTGSEPFIICVATDGLVNSPATGVRVSPLAANTSGAQPINANEGMCS